MAEKRVKVRLFGAFRNFSSDAEIECSIPEGATLSDLKQRLGQVLSERSVRPGSGIETLLSESVLADESRVLADSDPVSSERLAILPPVCGG